MSQGNSSIAEAINLPGEVIMLPAREFAAIMDEIRRLGDLTKEHEARLDKHSEYITNLRFDEEPPEITSYQKDRAEILKALLAANNGKMLAKDARQKMKVSKTIFSRLLAKMRDEIEIRPFHADRKKHLLILRASKG